MTFDKNPFPEGDADRHALWEMLVRRDIDAFDHAAADIHQRRLVQHQLWPGRGREFHHVPPPPQNELP